MNIYPYRISTVINYENRELSVNWMKQNDLKHLEEDVKIEENYLTRLFHDPNDFSHYLDTDH